MGEGPNPYQPPSAELAAGGRADEPVSFSDTLRVWWGLAWRFLLVSAAVGFVLGGVGGAVAVASGSGMEPAQVGAVLGQIGSIPASIGAVYWVLRRGMRGLQLRVVREGGPHA